MKALRFGLLVLGSVLGAAAQPDDALFTALLMDHVDAQGLVDYAALRTDERLPRYLATLAATDPATLPNDDARLAFWINAYNAFTLQLIADHYPIKSINELATGGKYLGYLIGQTAWDIKFAPINGERLTLNHIEHDIIRKRFSEPRIHFALVCAAISCPPLRREAFVAAKLETQLREQGEIFLRDPAKNRFDPAKRIATISKVFDWFKVDFGTSEARVLASVASFVSPPSGPLLARYPASWKIEYTHYNWALNAQP